MYRMGTVLGSVGSEMLKIPRTKVEVHFLKKLAFATNKCLTQDAFGKCPRADNTKPFKIHSSIRIVMCTNFIIISYILQSYPSKRAISVTAMHCPIQAAPKLTQK